MLLETWIKNIKTKIFPRWKKRFSEMSSDSPTSYKRGYEAGYWNGVEDILTLEIQEQKTPHKNYEV